MPRFLFDIADEASRVSLYDADRQALLAEFGGAEAREFLASVEGLYRADSVEPGFQARRAGCCGLGRCADNDVPPPGNAILRQSLSQVMGNSGMASPLPVEAGMNVLGATQPLVSAPRALGCHPWRAGNDGIWSEPAEPPERLERSARSARPAPLQPRLALEGEGDSEDPQSNDGTSPCSSSGEVITVAMKAVSQPPAGKRRKLWDIDHKYHCPLIGTCLSDQELRQLGERHAHRPREPLSEFDVHVSFVAAARERNGLSIATQKRLDKKYASAVRRLAKRRDPADLAADWREALETGQVPGMLWALLSHPLTDANLSERIYEDVHMLSHQIGAGQRADVKRLHDTQTELSRLRRDFDMLTKRSRAQLEAREQENHDLTRALREKTTAQQRLQAQVEALTQQCATAEAAADTKRLAGLERKLTHLDARLVRIQDERDHWRLATAEAESQCEQARQHCENLQASVQALEQRLAAVLANDPLQAGGQDLGGRQVLCIGGRLATVEQYRALIERCNGVFAHHDGGLEDNQNRLEAMLAAADWVVCVTEFVSHDAYRRTKRFCKRHVKPHALLANAGLGSFSRALAELAG